MTIANTRFLIVGFDALRPEMITNKNMPNLYQFAQAGVTFENHRCCYPSETYVNLPSLVTGSVPAQHGIVANSYLDKKVDPRQPFLGSSVEKIEKAQKAYQGKLYDTPTFGEILHTHGKRMAVISTNSSGSVRLKHYSIKEHQHLSFACHDPAASWPPEEVSRILKKCGKAGPLVIPDNDGITYATDVFLKHLVIEGIPELTILWYGEPDRSYHEFGVGSEQSLTALRHADVEFGRIINWWKNSDCQGSLQIIAVSDHAQITTKTETSIYDLLTEASFKVGDHLEDGAEIALVSAYSGNMLLKNRDTGLARAVGEALMSFDSIGMVFSQDQDGIEGIIPGSFSKKLAMVDHSRSPDICYILNTDNELDSYGLKGNCYFDTWPAVAGGGIHGGLHPEEMHNTCSIQGSLFREKCKVSNTSGIIDILPTVLYGLQIPIPKTVDGRILLEAMNNNIDPAPSQISESFEVGHLDFKQILKTSKVADSVYIDGGWRIQ
jgi:arylsulfatase A-like enzyme